MTLPSRPPPWPLLLAAATAGLLYRRMEVGALEADPARSGEAVEHEVAGAAAEEAGLEAVDLLLHLDRMVAKQPPPWLDVDRLPRLEGLLEHVAVSMDPDHALVIAGEELVDPEATAVEHVREALDAAVVVLDAAGGGEELVLAHDDPLPRLQMQRDDVTGRVAAEGDLTRRLRLEHSNGIPPNTRRLSPLPSGCRPICISGYFHRSTWCSKYTGTCPSSAMCSTGTSSPSSR